MRRCLPIVLLATPASATTLYSEADLGALVFVGNANGHAEPGPAFGARVGLAVAPWLSFGAAVSASSHQADVPTPSVGEYFQLYHAGLDLRVGVRLGPIGLFAEGGGGWAFFSTNILDSVAVTLPYRHDGPYLLGGAGVEYVTENPRFAFGVGGAYAAYPEFGTLGTVTARVYFRYTR